MTRGVHAGRILEEVLPLNLAGLAIAYGSGWELALTVGDVALLLSYDKEQRDIA